MVRNFRRSGQEPDLSLMSQGENAYPARHGFRHSAARLPTTALPVWLDWFVQPAGTVMRKSPLTFRPGGLTLIVGMVLASAAACAPAATSLHSLPVRTTPLDPERMATDAEEEASLAVMRQCAGIQLLTVAIDARGTRRGRAVRGRFWAAARYDGRIRLEPRESAEPFVLTAAADGVVVVASKGARVLAHVNSAEAIEAVLGASLNAKDLTHIITGCPRESGNAAAYALAGGWMKSNVGDRIETYLQPDGTRRWKVAAILGPGSGAAQRWRADFHRPVSGVPTRTRLVSVHWAGQPGREFDLDLRISQIQLNPLLDDTLFSQQIPVSARAFSLSDLRSVSPLN
jgi:hypothetical protein